MFFRQWMALAFIAGLASLIPPAAPAQQPLISDRPDFTESAATITPGRVQMEAGYTFARLEEVEGHAIGEILARIGVLSGVEELARTVEQGHCRRGGIGLGRGFTRWKGRRCVVWRD